MSKKIFWLLLIIPIAGIWTWQRVEDNQPMSFDRTKWDRNISLQDRSDKYDDGIMQVRMAQDLMVKQQLIGKSRSEIEQMLGSPTRLLPVESKEYIKPVSLIYRLSRNYIGLMGAFEQKDLVIQLDSSGKSVNAKIDSWKNGKH
jgi:hypothetical protein